MNEGASAPAQIRYGKAQPRTVIDAAGRPRRFVLTQPPHFRTGSDVIASVDKVALAATHAIARAGDDRSLNYRSNGTRPATR